MSLQSVNASRVSMECKACSRARCCPEYSKEHPEPTTDYDLLRLINIELMRKFLHLDTLCNEETRVIAL